LNNQHQGWSEQQAVLAEFGQFALSCLDLDLILQRACELVARGLQVPIAKILQAVSGGSELLIRAAVGLPPDIAAAGVTKVPGDHRSAAGYALGEGEPVISHIPTETRFEVSEVVRRAHVVVSANVLIGGAGKPFGTLEVDALEERTFTPSDISFLRNYANLLAAAVDRHRTHRELAAASEERAVLLRELQHRTQNDMAIITSMLRMEARRAKRSETRRRLESVGQRVEVLALVYRRLYVTGATDTVNLGNYLDELVKRRFLMHGLDMDDAVRLDLQLAAIQVDHSQAVAVGLIVNELVTNSLKYAFPLRRGMVSVSLERVEPGKARLVVADDGIGMPTAQIRGHGIGLELTPMLAKMAHGEFHMEQRSVGTAGVLTFSVPVDAQADGAGNDHGPDC
jgi:two-component sensor histidine kinase